jgi:cytochrome c biogenesis protein CcdA
MTTLGLFTGVLVVVLAVFGGAMAWAGSTVVAAVTDRWAREAIASVVLTVLGLMALALAGGELGLWRPWLPRMTTLPGRSATGLRRRTLAIALGFGATMAIFSPLSTYALVLGWVAANRSAWLGAATLAAYGLGLMVPLAIAGTLAARRDAAAGEAVPAWQERVRVVGGASLAVAGGFLLSMWTLRATWALFWPGA